MLVEERVREDGRCVCESEWLGCLACAPPAGRRGLSDRLCGGRLLARARRVLRVKRDGLITWLLWPGPRGSSYRQQAQISPRTVTVGPRPG